MFDAYTVKKVLPRLAIAVILIQLSWFLTTGAVFITNKVAFGIEGLMYGAFGGSANFTLDTLISSTSSSSATTIGLSALFVVAGTYFGGGVVAIAGFIIIALIVGFLSLAVRRAILILLVLLSPIAIVCWILPNTERFWKMWWDNFTKLLIMFPLIMAMIAAGRIFAKISGSTGSSDIVKVTIVIAGFFVPLLLIPKTFALAGSAFAAMGGAIAQRGAGAQNTVKGWGKDNQKKKWAGRGQRATNNNLFKGGNENNVRGRLNRLAQTGALANKAGFRPTRMRSKINAEREKLAERQAHELIEKNPDIQAVIHDDDMLRSLEMDTSREAIERRLLASGRFGARGSTELATAINTVEAAQRAGGRDAVRLAAVQGLAATGTGFATHEDMYRSIINATGGSHTGIQSVLAGARSASEKARRTDLSAPGHVAQATAIRDMMEGAPAGDINARMRGEALDQAGASQILYARTDVVEQLTTQLGADYQRAVNSGDADQAAELAGQIAGLRNASGSAPPAARRAVTDMLAAIGVDTAGGGSVDEQLGSQLATAFTAGVPGDPAQQHQLASNFTDEIRTRAGLYDQGTRGVNPALLAQQGLQQPPGGTPPPGGPAAPAPGA